MSRRRAGRPVDTGSISPLVPIVMFALLLLGGLVVDGLRALGARGNAQAFAEEAARAGATAIDTTSTTLALDPTKVRARVSAYCTAIAGTAHASVQVTRCDLAQPALTPAAVCGSTQGHAVESDVVVNTEVRVNVDTDLLGMIGVGHFTVSATARARPYEGTTADNAC